MKATQKLNKITEILKSLVECEERLADYYDDQCCSEECEEAYHRVKCFKFVLKLLADNNEELKNDERKVNEYVNYCK